MSVLKHIMIAFTFYFQLLLSWKPFVLNMLDDMSFCFLRLCFIYSSQQYYLTYTLHQLQAAVLLHSGVPFVCN